MISEENQDEDIDIELDEEEETDLGSDDSSDDEDLTDYKAEAEKWKGIAKRKDTKLQKLSAKGETKKETKVGKTSEIDYSVLAFHNSKTNSVKIEHEDDIEYLQDIVNKTGSSMKEVLADDFFQSKIKARQESRTIKAAIPSTSKRSNSTTRDEVGYWINKGELPPADQVQLRRDVLNARIKGDSDGGKFYNG